LQFSSAKKIEHSSISAVSTTPRDDRANALTFQPQKSLLPKDLTSTGIRLIVKTATGIHPARL
jgi:hypothetical protein